MITLFGDGWGLTIACPWEGTIGGRDISWEDDDIENRVWDLIGEDLVDVRETGAGTCFEFSSGTLTVAQDTDVDPWVLQIAGGLMVGRVTNGGGWIPNLRYGG